MMLFLLAILFGGKKLSGLSMISLKKNDFSGKTVIPFATSTSSDLGESGNLLAEMVGTGNWEEGQRFSSSATSSEVAEWLTEIRYEDFY